MAAETLITRPRAHPPFPDRAAYLSTNNTTPSRKFCNAIADNAFSGVPCKPWLTLVLGSGCSGSKEQAAILRGRIEQCLGQLPASGQQSEAIRGQSPNDIVREFAEDLMRDRLRLDPDINNVRETGSEPEPPGWLFDLLLCAAIVTKMHFRFKSLKYQAPRRQNHDDIAMLDGQELDASRLKTLYRDPCLQALDRLLAQSAQIASQLAPLKSRAKTSEESLKNLLQAVKDGLQPQKDQPVRIEAAGMYALAELSWLCLTLTANATVYPGWSDLLLELSHFDSCCSEPRIGPPLFSCITDAQDLIKERYKQITDNRWREISDVNGIPISPYRSAAELLHKMQVFRKDQLRAVEVPPVSVFVTSFDLELELELLRGGYPFAVVMPVYLVDSVAELAHTTWLSVSIPSKGSMEERIRDLLEPSPNLWSLVEASSYANDIVVVRLSGCPLITLPDIQASGGQTLRDRLFVKLVCDGDIACLQAGEGGASNDVVGQLALYHSVILNEHDALLHNEIDLVSLGAIADSRAAGAELYRGLPMEYVRSPKQKRHGNTWRRFWMMMGVQLHHSAFRHRLATLVSMPPLVGGKDHFGKRGAGGSVQGGESPGQSLADSDAQGAVRRSRAGLVVNRFVTELEGDLLYWNGFDAVRADAADFAADLEHYGKHFDVKTPMFNRGGYCGVC